MLYKNLTARELYSSIPTTATPIITLLFQVGLEIGSPQVAVSAMEELMIRGYTDVITRTLQSAFDKGQLKPSTTITSMIARSLIECHEDPILRKYGKALMRGEANAGVLKWVSTPEAANLFRSERDLEALQEELSKQKEAKDDRKAFCNDSSEDWLVEAILESFEPQGF